MSHQRGTPLVNGPYRWSTLGASHVARGSRRATDEDATARSRTVVRGCIRLAHMRYRGTSLITCGDFENACLFLKRIRNFTKNGCFFLKRLKNFSTNGCLFPFFFRPLPLCDVVFHQTQKNLKILRISSKTVAYFLKTKKLFQKRLLTLKKSRNKRSRNACFLSEPFLVSEVPLY